MTKEVQILYVSRYDFKDDSTGEIIKGCKVTFSSLDSLSDKDFKGYKINTINLPYEKYEDFANVDFPVKAEVEYDIVDTSKKPKVVDVTIL